MSGLWRVLITLQPPRRPDTQAWAGPLRASLRRAQAHTTVEDREIWEYRLANLDARRDLPVDVPQAPATVAAPTGHGGRVKRGLLNFVGELSRVLFGTATSDEVHALQESIKRLQDGMTVLHHNTRVMVSIVNQTRRYVRENRLDLRAVQAETMRLDQLARVTARRVHALELYQSRAQIRRQIDLAIQQMEMAIADYRLQRRIFHRQRLQMERGWLTEDILPRAALRQILTKIQASLTTGVVLPAHPRQSALGSGRRADIPSGHPGLDPPPVPALHLPVPARTIGQPTFASGRRTRRPSHQRHDGVRLHPEGLHRGQSHCL